MLFKIGFPSGKVTSSGIMFTHERLWGHSGFFAGVGGFDRSGSDERRGSA
jgi:hypothetical protein